MKAGIITFHRADNYGALLQMLGLYRALEDRGVEPQIVDYRCAAIEDFYDYRLIPKRRRNIVLWGKTFLFNLRSHSKLKTCSAKCGAFRETYLSLSRPVSSEADRADIEREYDFIVTGSDQIWNYALTKKVDSWYAFKRSAPGQCVLASYAASIGDEKRFQEHAEEYKKALSDYDFLSVREKDAQVCLQNLLNRNVEYVLDPTLLLPTDYWESIQAKAAVNIDQPYVLYYDAAYNKTARRIAQAAAKAKKMPLVHFYPGLIEKNSLYVQDAGPEDFLALIKNAHCVVTSSFHATVFAILFQKQFITVPHPRTGVRVRNLLLDFHLDDRLCETASDFSTAMIDRDINYERAFSRLRERQKESFSFIDKIIEKARFRIGTI